jgi:hypothetical protein
MSMAVGTLVSFGRPLSQRQGLILLRRNIPRRVRARGYRPVVPKEVVGAVEIARMLGVSRQRVNQLALTPTFPMPWRTLAQGRLWDLRAIERWAKRTGRELRPLG